MGGGGGGWVAVSSDYFVSTNYSYDCFVVGVVVVVGL